MKKISLRTLLTLFIIHVSWNYFITAETISPTVEERSEISSDPKLFDSNSITDDDLNHVDSDVPDSNNNEEEPVPDPMILGDTFSSTENGHENSSSEGQSLPAQLNDVEVTGTPTKLLLDDPLPAEPEEEKEEKEEDAEGAVLEVKMDGEEDTVKITGDSDKEEIDISINNGEMVDDKEEMKQDDDENEDETSPKPEAPSSEIPSDSHPPVVKVKDEAREGRQPGVDKAHFDSSKIWCYSCNSIVDEACEGHGSDFVGGEDYQCDCNLDKCRPSGVPTYRPPVGCMKIVQNIPDHPQKDLRYRIVRRCAYSDEVHNGRKTVGNKEVKIWSYQCNNTNECNKAGSLKLNFWGRTIILTCLLGVFYLMTFRI